MDVIALWQHGIKNAVATLGTAITKEHILLIMRYTDRIIFCFDGDQAGKKAAWKAVELLLTMMHKAIETQFIFLPPGEDPDSMIRKKKKSFFVNAYKDSLAASDFFFQQICQGHNLQTPEGNHKVIQTATGYLTKIPEGIFRDLMFKKLEHLTNIQKLTPTSATKKKPSQHQAPSRCHDQRLTDLFAFLIAYPQMSTLLPSIPNHLKEELEVIEAFAHRLHHYHLKAPKASLSQRLECLRDYEAYLPASKLSKMPVIQDGEKQEMMLKQCFDLLIQASIAKKIQTIINANKGKTYTAAIQAELQALLSEKNKYQTTV